MIKWLNPMTYYYGITGAWAYARTDPVGFATLWSASGIQTWVGTFGVSLAFPNWARDLASEVPVYWGTFVSVIGDFLHLP